MAKQLVLLGKLLGISFDLKATARTTFTANRWSKLLLCIDHLGVQTAYPWYQISCELLDLLLTSTAKVKSTRVNYRVLKINRSI